MLALEARIGGLRFGELYFQVVLGFRYAFSTYFRTGKPGPLTRTFEGEPLLDVGVEGDTRYFVALTGEAWAQDGIADRYPHRAAASFDELSESLCWPVETRRV
jgi:hypothetical protein